jgi:hypothetical protein
MNTKSPRSYSFIKFLRRCCLAGEIFLGVGSLLIVALIPYSEEMVGAGRQSIRITIPHGPFFVGCSLQFGAGPNSPDGSHQPGGNISDTGSGVFSVGPIRLRAANTTGASAQGVSIRDIDGIVTIAQADNAARALRFVRWPFLFSMICTGLTCAALLELARRVLRSVEKQEVFTSENIRNVYGIGIILIVSNVVNHLLVGWLVSRTIAFVTTQLPEGTAALDSSFVIEPFGIAAGLLIVALAEVFRQGLALKEENQLTI